MPTPPAAPPAARSAARRAPRAGGARPLLLAGGLLAGALGAALLAAAGGGAASAQEAARDLTVGVSTGVQANTNRSLSADGDDPSAEVDLRLNFGFREITPRQRLELSGGIGLRRVWEEDGDEEDLLNGLAEPDLRFSFSRAVPDTSLSLNARVRRELVVFLEPIDDFLENPDDPLIDPSDLIGSEDEGSRLTVSADAALELWRTAPVGLDLAAGLTARRYFDVTDPDLVDENRARVSAALRFTLDPVTQARVGLRYFRSEEEEDGEGSRELRRDTALRVGVTRQRPSGSVGVNATAEDLEDGERYTLDANFATRLPLWNLRTRLGVSRGVTGGLNFVGGLQAERRMRVGSFALNVDQSLRTISTDSDDAAEEGEEVEALVTGLGANYGMEVDPLTRVSANVSFLRVDPDNDDPVETSIRAGVGLQRQITREWSANVRLEHRFRDDEDGAAHDNAISLNLGRSFAFRP
jgi:hypothetical protein